MWTGRNVTGSSISKKRITLICKPNSWIYNGDFLQRNGKKKKVKKNLKWKDIWTRVEEMVKQKRTTYLDISRFPREYVFSSTTKDEKEHFEQKESIKHIWISWPSDLNFQTFRYCKSKFIILVKITFFLWLRF